MNRREFLGTAAAFAAMGARTATAGTGDKDFMWAFMPQFGMNMWGDRIRPRERNGIQTKILTDEEYNVLLTPGYDTRESIRFDEALWRRLSTRLQSDGCNLILIDVGEFVVYPSHPELAVKGSWSAERLNVEVKRLKAMGFRVIPKLNFSCCHDNWLKDYARMVSTQKYYEVVADLIRDVCEIFEKPAFVHLGLDEEDKVEYQVRGMSLVRFRQGDLWWHDVLYMVKEVEKHGARAWMWSDYIRYHEVSEFAAKMPKTVLQSPWTYRTEKPSFDDKLIRIFLTLAENGYDVVPCGSNCYGNVHNYSALAAFCAKNLPAERYKGMLLAPWVQTRAPYERLLNQASGNIAEARSLCGEDLTNGG